MCTINSNAVQGRLSENYLANAKIFHIKYFGHEIFTIYGIIKHWMIPLDIWAYILILFKISITFSGASVS